LETATKLTRATLCHIRAAMPSRNDRNGLKGSATPAPTLPVISFRKVVDEPTQIAGVHDIQARSYGCERVSAFICQVLTKNTVNDPNIEFKRPEAYIRYIGKSFFLSESRVLMGLQNLWKVNSPRKLNMTWMSKVHDYFSNTLRPRTSVDQEWLDTVNAERKKEQMSAVSHEIFEVIVDKIEKEWFELVGIRATRASTVLTSHVKTGQETTKTRHSRPQRRLHMCHMRRRRGRE
jgi:hypothetical protein